MFGTLPLTGDEESKMALASSLDQEEEVEIGKENENATS